MKCQSCGQVIPATARICLVCGDSTRAARQMRADRTMLIIFTVVGMGAMTMLSLYAIL